MHSEHILKERSDAQNVVSRFPCGVQPFYTTLGAQGQRPGGAINPRGEAASTYGNTGKHRPDPYPSSLPSRILSTRVWYLSRVDLWPTLMRVMPGREERRR